MTKNVDPVKVAGAVPQRSPEALRRLGRAVIGLARWQLDGAPTAHEAKSASTDKRPSKTAVSTKQLRPSREKL